MTAVRRQEVARQADPCEALDAVAWASAYLWSTSGIADLLDAVDDVQAFAKKHGVVEMFGDDYVMAVISAAFKPYRRLLSC